MAIDKTIDLALINQLAQLAGLYLNNNEQIRLKDDLSQILAFINQIKAIDTTNIEPMSNCVLEQRLRQDIVIEIVDSEQQAKFQKLAPQIMNGLYCVPKVKENC
jgi:aspartyl-tRNA(Asn)/glutamyl-tRNA(Gln) amidotransferase subunit C